MAERGSSPGRIEKSPVFRALRGVNRRLRFGLGVGDDLLHFGAADLVARLGRKVKLSLR